MRARLKDVTQGAARAAIYCRISDDRTGEAAGVGRQEEDCRKLAQSRGWSVASVYVDNDVSASSFTRKKRPEYQKLLQAMRDGTIDAVVIWHEDRLHRRPQELEGFIDLANAQQIQLATCTGDINLATPEGRLRARMLGGVGAYESEHKAARIKRKHEELAKQGKVSGGGTRPFGYDDDRVSIRPAEAKVIRDAARRVLAGESLRSVVRELNSAGVRTSAGKPWIVSALRRVLMSGRVAGWREYGAHTNHSELVAKAEWDGIISITDSKRLRAVLGAPSRRLNVNARRYLLTGFLRCGRCQTRLVARPRGDKRRCYVCSRDPRRPEACGKMKVLAEPLEELLAAMLFERVDLPNLARAIVKRRDIAKGEQRAVDVAGELEADLEDLARDHGAGRISRREWLAAREPLEKRLAIARQSLSAGQRLAALDGLTGKPGALRKAWPSLSLDRRRAIIGVVVDHATVGPALRGLNRFDPRRVDVRWRF